MNRLLLGKGMLLVILFALISTVGICADTHVTIVGKVIDDNEIITSDGEIYEIGNTEAGLDLLDSITDETQEVSVTGVLQQEDETMVIDVISYKIIEE